MKGIQYTKNEQGEIVSVTFNYGLHGSLLKKVFEEIEDTQIFDNTITGDDWVTMSEIRTMGIKKGIGESLI